MFAVLALSLALVQPKLDHLKFIVTGDDRGTQNGVNLTAMTSLAKAIVDEKPSILLFNGDTIAGGNDETEKTQYESFMGAMKPIYDSGIKVLMVRGNHEMHAKHANDLWRNVFKGKFENPQNGPSGEEDFTFFYKSGNCLFVGLDEFMTNRCVVNESWFEKVVTENPSKHVFAFAHKMAFKAGLHDDGMNTEPELRDKFLDFYASHGGTTLFFGHDHLYDHEAVAHPKWPKGKVIHQVVVGTAGAPFYHGMNVDHEEGSWHLYHYGHVEGHLGYCVVEVDGNKVRCTFKAQQPNGKYETADFFSYKVD